MIVDYNKNFIKQLKKSSKKIKRKTLNNITLFTKDPFHPLLNNHALAGKYQGNRSINITGDWRAIYQHIDENTVIFITLGTHSQLYS